MFVQTANQFHSKIEICNLNRERTLVNGKSILHVLSLGVSQGDKVEIVITGEDEQNAATALHDLILSDFAIR